jgi:hypothetical protein
MATGDEVVPAGSQPSRDNSDPVVDLDAGQPAPSTESIEFDLKPYDPDPVRDKLRGLIALILLGHVAFIVSISTILLWAKPWHWPLLKDYLSVVFAPLMTLLGTVIGYYFGVASTSVNKRAER